MKKIHGQAILMGLVMLVLAGFQVYWLKDNYQREKKLLGELTTVSFDETVRRLQDSLVKQKLQLAFKDSTNIGSFKTTGNMRRLAISERPRTADALRLLSEQLNSDTGKAGDKKSGIVIAMNTKEEFRRIDSATRKPFPLDSIKPGQINEVIVVNAKSKPPVIDLNRNVRRPVVNNNLERTEFVGAQSTEHINTIYLNDDSGNKIIIRIDSLFNDSIPLDLLKKEFTSVLAVQKMDINFNVSYHRDTTVLKAGRAAPWVDMRRESPYRLQLENSIPYLLKKIRLPIFFSIFLVGITLLAFIFLYRSLLKQRRLALMKNDLINNITHELKTPIATVGVALEALKNFNAIKDPGKTGEYLDISSNELQRLSLLVDKVLNLSMFENGKMEIRKERFDMKHLLDEVIASFRLQVEKSKAVISATTNGDTFIEADRPHLLSVVFNLLDNALKYSKRDTQIEVTLSQMDENIILSVKDNGIGIPSQYKSKIFEKFFRVPAGDTHNAKGHGLGLSYVAQVIRQHEGSISLESEEGRGSNFIIVLPKHRA